MRNWIWMLAMVATMSFGATLYAQEGKAQPKEEPKEQPKEGEEEAEGEEDVLEHYKKMFKDIDSVIGKTAVTEEGVKNYLAHTKGFKEAMKKDKKFEELKEKNLKEAFDHAVKSEAGLAYAKEKGIDLDAWLRTALRIMTLTFKAQVADMTKQQKEMVDWQRAQVEAAKAELKDEEYKEAIKELDTADAALKSWNDMLDSLPKAAEAETKVLEANAEKIAEAMEDDEAAKEEPKEEEGEEGGMK